MSLSITTRTAALPDAAPASHGRHAAEGTASMTSYLHRSRHKYEGSLREQLDYLNARSAREWAARMDATQPLPRIVATAAAAL